MKAYAHKYDKETFEYLHTFPLQKNPKREGEYLIAVNATRVALPAFQQNERPVFNKPKDQWSIVPDFRDREYWLPDGSFHKIEKLGEAIPAEALDEPPPPTNEELAEIERRWRNNEIALTDRVFVADYGPVEWTEADRTAAHETIMGYRRELKQWPDQPEFPNSDHRPTWPSDVPRPAI